MKPDSALNSYFPEAVHFTGEALRAEQLRRKFLDLEAAIDGIAPLETSPRIARMLASGAFNNTVELGGVLAAGEVKNSILLPPHEYYEAPDTAGGVLIFTQALRTVITPKPRKFRRWRNSTAPLPRTIYILSTWSDLRENHSTKETSSSRAADEPHVSINPERARLVPGVESFKLGIAAIENSVYCFMIGKNENYGKTDAAFRVEDAHAIKDEPIEFGAVDRQLHKSQRIELGLEVYTALMAELDLMITGAKDVERPAPEPKKRKFLRKQQAE